MNQDQWRQIKAAVALALEAPESERAHVVSAACGDDPELRHEVESLLAAATSADTLPEARSAIMTATRSLIDEQDTALRAQLESVLSHQYEIIRPLGSGGMGCVYLARERALDRFVAIKVLRPALAVAETHRERFRREARIAARLSHPGILGLYSFGEIDNLWYFVMAYVNGETLAERVSREGFLPWRDAHRILCEMADALDCAHRSGVVHRDIKPANILLDGETGRAILADFGISKMPGTADSLTATGNVIGTPDFMSPEQVTGSTDVDQRSDIYSLGAVAYVMLTGREPFRSDDPRTNIYRRIVEDPAPIETLVPSVPADLAMIVRKSMARERADRWGDARLLKEALTTVIAVDRLPDAVRDLPSFGPYAFIWAAGWLALALLTHGSAKERILLMLVALIVPFGLVLHLWNGVGREMRFLDLTRIALWPPEWWGLWWPRALRRPSDLWERLPWPARAVRSLLIGLVPTLLLLIALRSRLAPGVGIDAAEWSVFIVGIVGVTLGVAWARRKGLTLDQSLRLLLGPTLASPLWNEPALKQLLAPESGNVRPPDRDSPSDHLRAIREMLPLMSGRAGEVGLRSLATAENVVKAIGARDAALAALTRDAGPHEAERLVAQLDSLEAQNTVNSGERAELRDLVRHQLDLVRRMQSRRDAILGEHAHLMELIRALWSLVRATSDSHDRDDDAVARLQALCAEIELELAN